MYNNVLIDFPEEVYIHIPTKKHKSKYKRYIKIYQISLKKWTENATDKFAALL